MDRHVSGSIERSGSGGTGGSFSADGPGEALLCLQLATLQNEVYRSIRAIINTSCSRVCNGPTLRAQNDQDHFETTGSKQ